MSLFLFYLKIPGADKNTLTADTKIPFTDEKVPNPDANVTIEKKIKKIKEKGK
jgi:hypothetical protein